MFSKFEYQTLPLAEIDLDPNNPRVVTQTRLKTQEELLEYLFEHEDLLGFMKKIVTEGRNPGAERPYVVKKGKKYIVVEGNTRVGAYKVLAGLMKAPRRYASEVPTVSKTIAKSLLNVDCSIAPDRDALLPIMAKSHFGLGDKSKWGYLGSRKAVYDEWQGGRTINQLAKLFDLSNSQVNDLILEYLLYLEALKIKWTDKEAKVLLDPAVAFNPPVRFLQTKGHKTKVGINYDKANHEIVFDGTEAKKKFKHLIAKLVINPQAGLGATASYDEVFADFEDQSEKSAKKGTQDKQEEKTSRKKGKDTTSDDDSNTSTSERKKKKKYPGALFTYEATINDATLKKLMAEANELNCDKFAGAGTGLLRAIIETILKHKIHEAGANKDGRRLDLEGALNLVLSNAVKISVEDKKILQEFQKHVGYLNLGAHGSQVPNAARLFQARDCIDGYVKRNV